MRERVWPGRSGRSPARRRQGAPVPREPPVRERPRLGHRAAESPGPSAPSQRSETSLGERDSRWCVGKNIWGYAPLEACTEDVGRRQIEWLVNQNLQEGTTIKVLIYIFPAIVQQNLLSQLGMYFIFTCLYWIVPFEFSVLILSAAAAAALTADDVWGLTAEEGCSQTSVNNFTALNEEPMRLSWPSTSPQPQLCTYLSIVGTSVCKI